MNIKNVKYIFNLVTGEVHIVFSDNIPIEDIECEEYNNVKICFDKDRNIVRIILINFREYVVRDILPYLFSKVMKKR